MVGCDLPWLWLKHNRTPWLLIAAGKFRSLRRAVPKPR
ncbi:MAG: hypothetical protein EB072_14175 [Betaproteobacteria bacterium]|nr:hypothetical protein [Betaproteobacteria bacterium]